MHIHKCLISTKFLLPYIFIFPFTSFAASSTYKLDPTHSSVGFGIKHLLISTVRGHFNTIEGSGEFDPKTKTIDNISVTIDPASIDTNSAKRDEHLRNKDFFDVKEYKNITFKSTKVEYNKHHIPIAIAGNLAMHGVTNPVTLNVGWGGYTTEGGKERVAFTAKGTIDRKAFGLTWNKPLEKAAGMAVGDEVKLDITVEATQ